jgi:hypothetical protein
MPSSATSEVEISNVALIALGVDPITSLSASNPKSNAIRNVFYRQRDALFRAYRWSFAIKRLQLAADADAPVHTFSYAYSLPSDCVRLIEPDLASDQYLREWVLENGRILTDYTSPLDIRYQSRVEDPTQWDDCFCKVLALDIAIAVCFKLTGSNATKMSLREDRKEALNEARRAKAYEISPAKRRDTSWITVR